MPMVAPTDAASAAFPPPPSDWRAGFGDLGEPFARPWHATALRHPRWVIGNAGLACAWGWPTDWQDRAETLAALSGETSAWPGTRPHVTVYSGHQFGVWAGQLGDGRALMLGTLQTSLGRQEIQLKGSGPTPYSRRADGRAVLRSSIREYLASEAMHGLGIPTTRALALTDSMDLVQREDTETAAILTRSAPSFLRFGHFEHFCHHGQHDALRQLADHALATHFPSALEAPLPVAAMLAEVAERTAELLAAWQAVGFCHGVMNTDNMSLLGLTLDYGPYGFLDAFDPGHVCNHSDREGRYAYARQPQVAYWNLHALAQALVPLVQGNHEALSDALLRYRDRFPAALSERMRSKFGLQSSRDEDRELLDDALRLLAADRVDYTIFFYRLCRVETPEGDESLRDLFLRREEWDAWRQRYGARLAHEARHPAEREAAMRAVNPRYVLRNHLAEIAIRAAQDGDDSEIHRLTRILERPFDAQPENEAYAGFPPEWAGHLEISCSS